MKSLDLVQKMRGLCETENGTKIDALLQPELTGIKGGRARSSSSKRSSTQEKAYLGVPFFGLWGEKTGALLLFGRLGEKKLTWVYPSSLWTLEREETYLGTLFLEEGFSLFSLSLGKDWRVGKEEAYLGVPFFSSD